MSKIGAIFICYNQGKMGAFHYYDLGYCEAFIFDEFLINQIREGVTVSNKHNLKLEEIIFKHYNKQDVIYISNRVNSYAVDPTIYADTAKIENLRAICVVTDDIILKQNANFESKFFPKPYKVFTTLGDAIVWSKEFLLKEIKNSSK